MREKEEGNKRGNRDLSGRITGYNLTSPRIVRELLDEHGLAAKKSLGQNFLVDANILKTIIQAAQIEATDLILEIGAGIGALTVALSDRAGHVVAVEADRFFLPVLEKVLSGRKNITLIGEDILRLDLESVTAGRNAPKVVANLPYYISTPILFFLLESDVEWGNIVLMVQKEVAERVVSPSGIKTYGALSVMIQHYADAEIVAVVPPTVFLPRPKVESAILRLRPKKVTQSKEVKELFGLLVRNAFAHRRKTLYNSIKGIIPALGGEEVVIEAFQALGIYQGQRGETLTPTQFYKLALFFAAKDASKGR